MDSSNTLNTYGVFFQNLDKDSKPIIRLARLFCFDVLSHYSTVQLVFDSTFTATAVPR